MTQTASDGAPLEPSIVREIATVASLEFLGMVRGIRALLVIVMYGGLLFLAGSCYSCTTAEIEKKLVSDQPELSKLDRGDLMRVMLNSERFKTEIAPGLEKYGGQRLIDAVGSGRLPVLVLILLVLSSVALPGIALLTGFDRLSDDLHTRYARFVLQRVRRETWVVGRILGQWALLLALVIGTHVLLVGLGSVVSDRFDAGPVWRALPLVWAAMAVFLLAYVALVSVFSALITPPFGALAVGVIALMGLGIAATTIDLVGMVWMGSWSLRLWLLDPLALVVFVAHALALAAGAMLIIRARDV